MLGGTLEDSRPTKPEPPQFLPKRRPVKDALSRCQVPVMQFLGVSTKVVVQVQVHETITQQGEICIGASAVEHTVPRIEREACARNIREHSRHQVR